MSRSVTIAAGQTNVVLPNGNTYNAADVVVLTDAEFAQIPASLFPGTVIDGGFVANPGDGVSVQGAGVTLTSTVAAGATPTKAEFDALRADVVALEAALSGVGKPLA